MAAQEKREGRQVKIALGPLGGLAAIAIEVPS